MRNRVLRFTLLLLAILLNSCDISNFKSHSLENDSVFKEFVGKYPLANSKGLILQEINLMPDGTFRFEVFSSSDSHSELNGQIELDQEYFHLSALNEALPVHINDLIAVRWGARRYLIETARRIQFCDSIMEGNEPRDEIYGSFYMKSEDWNIHVEGPPFAINGNPVCAMD